jgi:hypothetical protein
VVQVSQDLPGATWQIPRVGLLRRKRLIPCIYFRDIALIKTIWRELHPRALPCLIEFCINFISDFIAVLSSYWHRSLNAPLIAKGT